MPGRTGQARQKPGVTMAERVHKQLLTRYSPAAVLVGDRFEVLYLYGPTADYLDVPSGSAPFDLLAMCPPQLRHPVRVAVGRARRDMQGVVSMSSQIERGGVSRAVKVIAEPLGLPDQPGVLVTFEEDLAAPEPSAEPTGAEQSAIWRLKQELRTTKDDLNDTIEALENSNRELTSASDEANTLNEELQATNEELETSREELQSLNEELTSLNNQLNEKLNELEGTNNDLINLLASTDLATIFLGHSLHIRRFTPATLALLSLLPTDQGRPVADFARKFSDERLLEDAQHVLNHLQPIEKEIKSSEGGWYLRRIHPYRTTSHQIDGVVITFTEITRLKAAETALQEAHEKLLQRTLTVEGQVQDRTAALGVVTQDLKERSAELATQKELFETIVDHAPVGIVYYNRDLTVRWANPSLLQMLGVPIERVIGQRASEVFQTLGDPICERLREVLEDGRPVQDRNVSFPVPSEGQASTRFVDFLEVPVREADGQLVGVLGMFMDVTERVDRERIQEDQILKLREVDRLKSDFLNAASHELRTPLASVAGYAEFLEDRMGGPLTEEQSGYVAEIQKGSRRLQLLVDDLLDFARIEAGTFALACQETDLRRLLLEGVASLRPQAEEARLSLEVSLPEAPQTIIADPQRVGQVILNIVGNALKFTMPGGRIEVKLLPQPDEMRVEIHDTGVGIPPELHERLFERFFQVDPSLTRTRGGTGLGLAISKSIVEAHGGNIGVKSEPKFWFTLPRSPVGSAKGCRSAGTDC